MYEVVCVGDVAVDDVYLVKHLPGPDEKVHARHQGKTIGGTTFNTVQALHQFGHQVAFFTLLGDDANGRFVHHQIQQPGLQVHAARVPHMPTPATLILRAENGEKAILLFFDPSDTLAIANQVVALPVEEGQVYFTTGSPPGFEQLLVGRHPLVMSLERPTLERSPEVYAWARANAQTLILDRNAFRFLVGQETTSDHLCQAAQGTHSSIQHWIVTLGDQGSMGYEVSKQAVVTIPPYPIHPIDTTGAGDIFNAAYIHATFFQKRPFYDALAFANAIAAASCEEAGPRLSAEAFARGELLYQQEGGAKRST